VRLLDLFGDLAVIIQLILLHTGLYNDQCSVFAALGDFDRMFFACLSSVDAACVCV
jgi:hypothetical protein